MATSRTLSGLMLLIALAGTTTIASAQEYDDLYFNANDRKKVEKQEANNQSLATYRSYSNNTYSDNYSAHEVNPEYIARYQSDKEYSSNSGYADVSEQTSNAQQPSYSNVSYYPESYDNQGSGSTVINNYYASDPYFNNPYANNWNNPRWGFGSSLWYDPWFGWNTGFNVSFGWGWGSGFNNPYWYSPGFAGGWYSPWGWNTPYYGFGWNNWNRFNNAYAAGFYDGAYGGYHHYSDNAVSRRKVVTGARNVRGGSVVQNSRTGTARSSGNINSAGRANVSDNRDYSRTQNEYFSRSRTSVAKESNSRGASVNNNSSGRTNTPSNSSYSRSRSADRSLSSGSSSTGSRRYNSSNVSSDSRSSSPSRSSFSNSSSRSSNSWSSGSTRSSSGSSFSRSSSGGSSSRSSSGATRSSSSSGSRSGSSRSRSGGGL